jgi:hypothetical protein
MKMTRKDLLAAAVAAVLGLSLATSPALAQGKGKAKQQERARAEQQRTGGWDDWYPGQVNQRGNGSGKVPPGWCQGVGNPHNTPENCGYYQRDSRTYPVSTGRTGGAPTRDRSVNGGRSYDQLHADFHRELDARYQRLSARRPLDVAYQLELRARKRAEHDEWHRRMGISHD